MSLSVSHADSIHFQNKFPIHALPPERIGGLGLDLTGSVHSFAIDDTIYHDGEKNAAFYRVVTGVVRTTKLLQDGVRQVDAFLISGDVFGFEFGDEHHHSAEAVSDCTVIRYNRRGLDEFAAANPLLAIQLFNLAVTWRERAQAHARLLGRSSARQRIAAFLLDLADRSPSETTVELVMLRQDIADYLGLTIETVSRTFSQLMREGLISRPEPRCIGLLDRSGLRNASLNA